LIAERAALGHDAIWREAEDGRSMTLIITKAGLAAVGMLPEINESQNPAVKDPAQKADVAANSGPTAPVSQNQRRPRPGSKLAMLVELLERNEGATIDEMVAALNWQQHTIRGVMSGALAKKFGLRIVSEPIEGRGRMYRTESGPAPDADKAGNTVK
jgi:hypothetical protein